MKTEIKKIIEKALKQLHIKDVVFGVEVPGDTEHGDYSSNVSLAISKKIGKNPLEIANLIKDEIGNNKLFDKVEIAGPGFINFFISSQITLENIKKINKDFGKNAELKDKKVIIDYTDPNPFKDFHIGHLMSNAIGESLSRIFEFQGAKVKRVCYQGDVGIHVAKAIWGKINNENLAWGQAYAYGAQKYEDDENVKKEITELNKIIYNRSDKKINELYDQGKKDSLKHFDEIYKKLNTKFDYFIFETETGDVGGKIVEKGLKVGIFEKGEKGAVIFRGEKCGLHTRVFINSEGLPTYEAKDLGLAEAKYKRYKYDKSVVVTGNEVNEYFKVMLCAMKEVLPKLAEKTKHIGHGMLRLPEGKMSSRTGKVVTGESLLEKVQNLVTEKIKERDLSDIEKKEVAEKVAVGAIRYSILKQSIGSDIIYDFNKSISFEGDSGPYLQYAYTRAQSILRKAKEENIKASFVKLPQEVTKLEKMMRYFPEVVLQASQNYEPHIILTYLTKLAGEFNNYYAKNKIVDKGESISSYRVALTKAFAQVMENGMWMLGIETLNKM